MFRIVKPDASRPFTIGRKEGSDLHFSERFVSREHAIIERTPDGRTWKIRSLTTNSFTLLNDSQINEAELRNGDVIGIGVKQLRVDLKGNELSLLLLDANDAVEQYDLESEWKKIEFGDEDSRKTIRARKLSDGALDVSAERPQNSDRDSALNRSGALNRDGALDRDGALNRSGALNRAEIEFGKAVIDENGKSHRRIELAEGESTRYDHTEISLKGGSLLIHEAVSGFDVHVRNLDVFAGNKQLLSGIDFDLPAGEILAIIGRSGQGKSSLLKLFAGSYRKGSESEVLIGGVDYRRKEIRERIAILAQDPPLRRDMTIDETLLHGARIALDSREFGTAAAGRLEKFCELFQLSERRRNRIKTLSGGEHRRVALAQELMGTPGLIILDEPLSGLDPFNSRILCSHLKQLAFIGHTVILTTHSYEALHIANKVLVLHQGEQCFYGTPQAAYQFFKTTDPETILSNLGSDASAIWQKAGIASRDALAKDCGRIYFTKQHRKGTFLYGMRLTLRQWVRDRGKFAAIVLQPLVIGFLFSQIFSAASSLWTVAFAVILCANWFALSLSIREIVQEKDIIPNELRKGGKTLPLLAGKFLVPWATAFLQTAIVFAFILFRIRTHADLAQIALAFACTAAPAVAIGLLVSSLSKNSGQANAFLPLLIIPQVALAGALVPLDQMQPIGKWLSAIVWSRYNQSSLLNALLERPDDAWNKFMALILALIFCIITAFVLHRSKKAR